MNSSDNVRSPKNSKIIAHAITSSPPMAELPLTGEAESTELFLQLVRLAQKADNMPSPRGEGVA